MKTLLLVTIFLSNILFANYTFSGQNSGQIDMHGGKSESLLNQKNGLSNSNFKEIGISKPIAPIAPKILIEDEKKKEEKKEITK